MRLLGFFNAILLLQYKIAANFLSFSQDSSPSERYLEDLKVLTTQILSAVDIQRCLAIITDDTHLSIYNVDFFTSSTKLMPYYIIRVNEIEDLLAPNFQTTQVLKQIQRYNCDLHIITLLNGLQMKRFLRFIYKYRALNVQSKFLLLYDERILEADMLHVWSTMVSTVMLRWQRDINSFSISTIAYPGILSGTLALQHFGVKPKHRRASAKQLFAEKSRNLKGITLNIAIFEHVPMVYWVPTADSYQGVEIEIIKGISKALNFQPNFYKTADSESEGWGNPRPNGTYTGLIGQLENHIAHFAIGDLHLFGNWLDVIDVSLPHSYECLTFLTPESTQDNSWKTLILPFSGGMWLCVLLSLFVVGTVFYIISYLNSLLMRSDATPSIRFFNFLRRRTSRPTFDVQRFRDVRFRVEMQHYKSPSALFERDLFDDYGNCILFTYSMLLYVALPRMPRNWPLRMLTGWYWIYCILLTVTYRASFTAILANPAARVTIDTLEDLVHSRITPFAWGSDNKQFFVEAFDVLAQRIGVNLEIVENKAQITERIAKGQGAYYDNAYFLRHLRVLDTEQRTGTEVLHIMRDCVVYMPVVLGMQKHTPLKAHIDGYVQRLAEGGFISKWLNDAVAHLPVTEEMPQEALINLNKFWSSFVALAFGYFLSICAVIAEKWHFKHYVSQHPLYDVYNPSLYYNFKRSRLDL